MSAFKTVVCPECGEKITRAKNHIRKHIVKHYAVDITKPYSVKNPTVQERIDFLVEAIDEKVVA